MILDSNNKCRIIVDAMGGDFAPENCVKGALLAVKEDPSIQLYLAGDKEKIQNVLSRNDLKFDDNFIINTSQVIEMGDSPTSAIKSKPDSSIVIGAKKVKENEADAFVSAGNTGAVMAASTLIMGRLKGVGRPTIGATFPSVNGVCTVFDVGASVDSKPQHLLEYGLMGSIFVEEIFGIKNPKVGLLSVGEEESKGSQTTLAAYKLLKNSDLNFKGNVEGRDILNGKVDLVVCDGYTGNIILKFGESMLSLLKHKMKKYAEQGLVNKLKVLFSKGTLKDVLKDLDYQRFGGVPLLGVNGISIIGHGSSSELAIKNMVLSAKEMYDKKLLQKLENSLKKYGE